MGVVEMRHRDVILSCLRRERMHAEDEVQRLTMEITRSVTRRKLAEAWLVEWQNRVKECREAIQDVQNLDPQI